MRQRTMMMAAIVTLALAAPALAERTATRQEKEATDPQRSDPTIRPVSTSEGRRVRWQWDSDRWTRDAEGDPWAEAIEEDRRKREGR
jgi:hypothetical protein